MRLSGTLLVLGGLVVLVVGFFMGCGKLFAWNGRHPVDVIALTPGAEATHRLEPVPGRRYTVSVQIVFERDGTEVSAKMPLVAAAVDARGITLAETTGWIDPDEAPTVMLGSHPSPRHVDQTELVAERIVGAFPASSGQPVTVRVTLGEDRLKKSLIQEARLVIYDDVIPASIKGLLVLAAAGALAFVVGCGLLVASIFRRSRRRGGVRRPQMMLDARP